MRRIRSLYCARAASGHAAAPASSVMNRVVSSLDHLVGEREQVGRNFEAERLCGFDVDRELELGRLLDRKLAWLLPAQDAVDIGRGAPENVVRIGAVRHESSLPDKRAIC